MITPKATVVALLSAAAIAALSACNPNIDPTATTSTGATVQAIDDTLGPDHPATHQTECQTTTGDGWLVTITATQAKKLKPGDPCPHGKHELLPQQQYPDIWSALNTTLPYSGGDANGPCGEWSAADPTDANQMRDGYATCMAKQHRK